MGGGENGVGSVSSLGPRPGQSRTKTSMVSDGRQVSSTTVALGCGSGEPVPKKVEYISEKSGRAKMMRHGPVLESGSTGSIGQRERGPPKFAFLAPDQDSGGRSRRGLTRQMVERSSGPMGRGIGW
jgi:hypothetical protein